MRKHTNMFVGAYFDKIKTAGSRFRFVFIAVAFLLSIGSSVAGLTQKAAAAGGWSAKYWNWDIESAEEDFPSGEPDLTRTDQDIDFDWEDGSPGEPINSDSFAAEWTKTIAFDGTGYKFNTRSDDGARVFIDDELLYEVWYDQGGDRQEGAIAIPSAGNHTVKVQYYENTAGARISLSITKAIGATDVIGQPDFESTNTDGAYPSNQGFDFPYAVQIDAVHHRLFVGDSSANRITVYNLDNNNQLADKTADYVLGQPDFRESYCQDTSASSLCTPWDMAYDPVGDRLFVTDGDHHRVVVYDTATITNGEAATIVLGQPDFETDNCHPVDAATMCQPWGVAYDQSHKRLFVSDSSNHRVLVFDATSLETGQEADNVLGQEDFDSSIPECEDTASNFCWASSLEYDSAADRLFVSDSYNQRVMIFDVAEIVDGESAVNILGKETLTTDDSSGEPTASNILDPRSLSYDTAHKRLFVADGGSSAGNRVLVYDLNELVDGEAAVNVLGQSDFDLAECDLTDSSLCRPYGVDYDAAQDQLFVADSENSRVLVYDTETIEDGQAAFDVLGQSDFESDDEYGLPRYANAAGLEKPFQNAIDTVNHRLFVVDRNNDRVVVYDLDDDNAPDSKTAAYAIGKPDLETSDEECQADVSEYSLCDPFGVAYDQVNNRLFVSDKSNNRVLVYDVSLENMADGMAADYVIGQPDFGSTNNNNGGRSKGLRFPMDMAFDDQNQFLYVADRDNNRIVGFDVDPDNIENHMLASRVFGQANLTSGSCNRDSDPADNTLCFPRSVAVNPVSNQLFVADGTIEKISQNRIMVYDLSNYSHGQSAVAILGQTEEDGTDCDQGNDYPLASGLCGPMGLSVDNTNNLLYVNDEWNQRILAFDTTPSTLETGQEAAFLIGQANFNEADWCPDLTSAYTICGVLHISVDQESHAIYVSDANNNRVLYFPAEVLGLDSENDPGPQDTDADRDGISDAIEDEGPNGGDANDDGIADSLQAYVASFINTINNQYAVLEVSEDCNITAVAVEAESASHKDAGFDYPVGLMRFTVICEEEGASTVVKQYFYGLSSNGLGARKYDSVNHSYRAMPNAVVSQLTIDNQTVTQAVYTITDGGDLDEDGRVDRTIIDPSGVASSVVGAPNTGFGRK